MTHLTTRRRATTLGVALVATALALTGCGRSGGDTSSSASTGPAIDDKPATGTVQVWADGADGDKLPEMFAEFKKDNPDVTLKLTKVPSSDFTTKMTAAITAGTVPDLIYGYTEDQGSLLATGGFDPVPTGLVKESDFFPAIWNNSVVKGVQYGVPWYAYAQLTMYRTDLAEKAGVSAPTDWDSLKTFAEGLKKSGVKYPIALYVNYDSYTARQLLTFARQNGGDFISADNKTWTINSKANVEALEYWASFIKSGLASADGPAFLDTVSWTSTGKNAGIVDGGPWFVSWFDDANGKGWAEKNLTLITMPKGPNGAESATVGGGSWMVPSDSKNKDAAWKFARWMSQPAQQVEWYQIFKNMPAVKSAWEDPAMANSQLLKVVEHGLETGKTTPTVPTWTQVGDIIGQQMEKVVRGGESAQQALDAAQKQAESIGMGN